VRPNFLAQLLGLLAEQRSQQQRPQDYLKEIASLLSRVRGRMR
jgi:adenylosuccinate lyase